MLVNQDNHLSKELVLSVPDLGVASPLVCNLVVTNIVEHSLHMPDVIKGHSEVIKHG